MDKQWKRKETLRYSLSFQQMIVKEVEEKGQKISEVSKKYGIAGGETIKKWIWNCKNIHKIPKAFEIVSISKDNKLYLLSDNSIYEWSIFTGGLVGSIFLNEKERVNMNLLKLFV